MSLDGIMRVDMQPFEPFSAVDPFFRLVDFDALRLACVVCGPAGGAHRFVSGLRRRGRSSESP